MKIPLYHDHTAIDVHNINKINELLWFLILIFIVVTFASANRLSRSNLRHHHCWRIEVVYSKVLYSTFKSSSSDSIFANFSLFIIWLFENKSLWHENSKFSLWFSSSDSVFESLSTELSHSIFDEDLNANKFCVDCWLSTRAQSLRALRAAASDISRFYQTREIKK